MTAMNNNKIIIRVILKIADDLPRANVYNLHKFTFEGFEIFDAEPRSFEPEEFRFFDGVLLPFLGFLRLAETFISKSFLQFRQPLLTFHVLSYQVAVVILQRHLYVKSH